MFVELPTSADQSHYTNIGNQDGSGADCAINMLSILTTLPYRYIWERMPRSIGGGTYNQDVVRFLHMLREMHSYMVPFPLADMINSFRVNNAMLPALLQEHYKRACLLTKGTMEIGHGVAWIDGKIYDSNGESKQLESYDVYAIIPVEFK